MRELPLLSLLFLYIGAVAGMPAKQKGSDFWPTISLDTVQVNTFPNQTVKLSLADFKVLADQNRALHNSVLPMAKVNSTLFPHNILLFGNSNMSSVPGDDENISSSSLLGDVNWPTFIRGGYIFCNLVRYTYFNIAKYQESVVEFTSIIVKVFPFKIFNLKGQSIVFQNGDQR